MMVVRIDLPDGKAVRSIDDGMMVRDQDLVVDSEGDVLLSSHLLWYLRLCVMGEIAFYWMGGCIFEQIHSESI